MINNMRKEFYEALSNWNSTPITSNQQCHLTQQQIHRTQSHNVEDLLSISQDLKNEVKALKEDKEDANPNKPRKCNT